MPVVTTAAFARPERFTEQATTKLTPSEFREVQEVLEDLQSQGIDGVTLSSLTRTALLGWVRAYRDEEEAD